MNIKELGQTQIGHHALTYAKYLKGAGSPQQQEEAYGVHVPAYARFIGTNLPEELNSLQGVKKLETVATQPIT